MPRDMPAAPVPLTDRFGRAVRYLRLSVTDRCDLRCRYCMSARPVFLPKPEVLSLEELALIADTFIGLGVRTVRLTGGEPLVRRGVMDLVTHLGRRVADDLLDEVALTTNGTLLAQKAGDLAAAGVRRVNVSLDTLDADAYGRLTRGGDVRRVTAGIEAARAAGLAVKINAVAMESVNGDTLGDLTAWAADRGCDVTFIEMMPLTGGQGLPDGFLSGEDILSRLARRWTIEASQHRTAGPSRYVRVAETGQRIGIIAPMSTRFCAGCDRVRVTCTGRIHGCLGNGAARDLSAAIRSANPGPALRDAITGAVAEKVEGHDFLARPEATDTRSMGYTGG